MFLPLHDQNPIRHVKFPYVTYGLIAVNVVVFLLQLAHQPQSEFNNFAITYAAIPDSAWAGPVLDRIPLLLFGMEFWRKVINFEALAEAGTISPDDPSLFTVVDSAEEGWAVVQQAYNLPDVQLR